ncbi:RIO1 family regulatory kinase/ATPase domain-containing protein [Caminibacter pacificus]
MRYDVIEKIGEGNRGEVYKVRLENGELAALKWSKSYEIDKEWEILNYLKGTFAPKPIFRGKKYLVMELIEGKPLKEFIGKKEYYVTIKEALKGAYELDRLGVFHKQLGRYYHIIKTEDSVKFLDFERAVFSENPRNFLQIIGYYLHRDSNFDKKDLNYLISLYKENPKKSLEIITKVLNEIIDKTI